MTLNLVPPESPAIFAPDEAFMDGILPLLGQPSPLEMEKEDASRYFFALCKRLDSGYLKRRGITCLFEVSGGSLSGISCRTVGLMVAALVIDIAAHARLKSKNGVVTVTLRCLGAIWACSVSDSKVLAKSQSPHQPEVVRRLALRLDTQLIRQETGDGGTTAFIFAPAS